MPPASPIVVRDVPVSAILDLRHAVLRAELPRESAHFDGDGEFTTMHFAAYDDARPGAAPVGCASLVRRPWGGTEPAYQLRGMAVAPDHQGRGVGRALLAAAEGAARDVGCDLLWANCRLVAVDFYRKLGWAVASDLFDIPTAGPHYKMVKRGLGPQMNTDEHR